MRVLGQKKLEGGLPNAPPPPPACLGLTVTVTKFNTDLELHKPTDEKPSSKVPTFG